MTDARGQATLDTKKLSPMPDYSCEAEMDVKSLPPGKYTAKCRIDSRGQQVAEQAIPFEKLPLPEWYGNTIGITDRVPKPFTPLRRTGDTIACWGREYRYEKRLFPSQITTQGRKLLSAPMELVLTDTSGRQFSSADAPTQESWGKQTDFRMEFQRGCRLGESEVQTNCWIECDGLLWTTLRMLPSRQAIKRLVVRTRLPKESSEYINPYDYSTATAGRLKAEGWQGGSRIGQTLWLGSPYVGLQFATETLAPCRLARGTEPERVTVLPESNLLEVTLIDQPTVLDQPWEVSWGWIATPVRPPTPEYRGWLTGNCQLFPGYQWYVPPGTDLDPRWLTPPGFLGQEPRPDGKGKRTVSSGPYVVTEICSIDVPEFAYWGDEWSPSLLGRKVDSKWGACSVAAQSWTDYLVWCYRRLYDRSRYKGLYYDCALYLPDDNTYHGAGHKEGSQYLPTHPFLAARRLHQRMYCMLRDLEPERTMILYHQSGVIDAAALSWCDVFVDGENFTSRLNKKEPDYHRLYPVDAFLAQSMGHNIGPSVWFLDEFTRSGAVAEEDWKRLGTQPVTHLYGLILLHDSGYWKAYGLKEGYEMVDQALRKYSFDDRYRMIPYWNQTLVHLPEKVYATFYADDRAKRVLMVLLNNTDKDLSLRLRVDWAALGYQHPDRLGVDDAVFHEGPRSRMAS